MTRQILLAEIMHETNTFNTIATTRDDFAARYWLEGEEVADKLANTNTEICGFLEAARHYDWQVTLPLAASASPSGPMAVEDWKNVVDLITSPLRQQSFDAVVLVLHGAMVTQTTLDAEGELLGLVNELSGPDAVIAVTLDMHANVSDAMVENAHMMMAYRTYPHVDQAERGKHMAKLLEKVFREKLKPKLYFARRAMMDGANHGQTAPGQPMPGLLAKADVVEADERVLCASIQIGFPWADVACQGPSVLITGVDDDHCTQVGAQLMEDVWQSRHDTQLVFPTPEQAMAEAKKGRAGEPPLVLADFADNPAAGAYGDSANLLRHMLAAKLSNAAFATICDPASVEQAIQAGKGAFIEVRLGGCTVPEITPPLEAKARVKTIGDGKFICAGPMWKGVAFAMGRSVVLVLDDIEVIVSSVPTSVMDLNVFNAMGIDPEARTTLAVKSRNHFKAAYGPIARKTMLVDAGGIASMQLSTLPYKNLVRPVWPLDDF
jgi:microcystin degradation protein MlrC